MSYGVKYLDKNHELYISNNTEYLFKVYCYLINRKQQLINKTLSKESFMLHTLDELWRLVR